MALCSSAGFPIAQTSHFQILPAQGVILFLRLHQQFSCAPQKIFRQPNVFRLIDHSSPEHRNDNERKERAERHAHRTGQGEMQNDVGNGHWRVL